MSKNKKIILIVLFTSFLLGLFFYSSQIYSKNKILPISENIESFKTILEINGTRYEDEIKGEISVYDFMNKLRNEGKINFTEKTYAGMGKLIEEINGLKNNGDKYWIYYVNDIEMQVGVSNYKIKKGDIVSFKYEKENF